MNSCSDIIINIINQSKEFQNQSFYITDGCIFISKRFSKITKCPELLTGKNSVIPCTIPNKNACIYDIKTTSYLMYFPILFFWNKWEHSFIEHLFYHKIYFDASVIHFLRLREKIMPFFRCENITPFYKFGICNAPFGIAIICL